MLALAAVSIWAWYGYVLADAWSFQRTEGRQLEVLPSGRIDTAVAVLAPATGGLVGRIDIPRLSLSVVVIEGTGSAALRRAAGHISGTAMPGQRGNMGISAHRDTFFRPLRNIRKGDVITVTTREREYRYGVLSTHIVMPSNVAVLQSDGRELLTLVTCYPFYFVGAAPGRFIVQAERLK